MRIAGLVFILVPAIGLAQDPVRIVRHYFDTVSGGDIRNWNKVRTAYIESISAYSNQNFTSKSNNYSEQEVTLYKTYRNWPRKSRIDGYRDSVIYTIRYHVGSKNVFSIGNLPPVEVSADVYDPYFEFETIMVKNIFDKRKHISMEGIEEIDGVRCYGVMIITKNLVCYFYFNEKTFLLEYWGNTVDGKLQSLTRLSDYRKFGDLLIPMLDVKSTNFENFKDGEFSWNKRTRIELNGSIDPKVFEYPW